MHTTTAALSQIEIPPPERVCFWSGAGISVYSPSNLPLGTPLTRGAIEAFCLPGTWEKVLFYLQQADLVDELGKPKRHPRLEAVLHSIVGALGYDALRFLSVLDAPPNDLHYFFAWHLSQGGKHVTLNMDDCIRQAFFAKSTSPHPASPDNLTALHSCWHAERLDALGVTIESVARGFEAALKDRLIQLFEELSLLVFIGYSGSDYFDVDPFFREMRYRKPDLRNLRVIWVQHADASGSFTRYTTEPGAPRVPILESLSECSVPILLWEGRATDLIREVAARWNAPSLDLAEQVPSKEKDIDSQVQVSDDLRLVATANLFLSMGLGREVVALSDSLFRVMRSAPDYSSLPRRVPSALHERIIHILNEAYREVGLYKRAHRILANQHQATKLDQLFWLQRAAGDYWLMGAMLRSWLVFQTALRLCEKLLVEQANPSERKLIERLVLETNIRFLHLCRDVLRLFPACAGLVIESASTAIRTILSIEPTLRESPYDKAYIVRLVHDIPALSGRVKLPAWLLVEATYADAAFHETDNLLGAINTARRRMINDQTQGINQKEAEVRLTYERSVLIGDLPGVLKAGLLLRRMSLTDSPTSQEIWRSLFAVEWVMMRKIVWVAAYAVEAFRSIRRLTSRRCAPQSSND